MLQRLLQCSALALTTVFAVPDALAVPINVTSNFIDVTSKDDATSFSGQIYNDTAIPASQVLTVTNGNSSNTTTINFNGDVNNATLSVDVLHSIDNRGGVGFSGTPGCCDNAYTASNSLRFTADVNANYSISGFYDTQSSMAISTYLEARLYDATTNTLLFREMEWSDSTQNESFLLDGLATGDLFNTILGSLTGNLIAGNDYLFSYQAWIQAADINDVEKGAMASATGNITLAINATAPASVAEPSLLALLTLGLFSMGVLRRRS